MTTILSAALAVHAAGLSPIPIAADGTKRPALHSWKRYQTQPASEDEIRAWFAEHDVWGLGVATGYGHLEMLELEATAMPQLGELVSFLTDNQLIDVWRRAAAGWSEQSPSGGLHLLYRIDGQVPGNTKIARAADLSTLVETRGAGGQTVLAPSAGTVHPTGLPYVRLAGGPDTIATLTRTERDELHLAVAACLDAVPDTEPWDPTDRSTSWDAPAQPTQPGDVTPGDDYEQRTSWQEILTGWTQVSDHGRYKTWTRPGKSPRDGISATTGHADDRDRLYVFSSNAEPFQPERPYTKFAAYALLQHGGDFHAAAKELHARGYGKRAPRPLEPRKDDTGLDELGANIERLRETSQQKTDPKINVPASSRADQNADTTTDSITPAPPAGRHLALIQGGNAQPKPAETTGEDDDLTDTGNARLAEAEYHHRLRYIPDAGKWAVWEGTRWKWAPDQAPAIQACLDIADRLPDVDKPTHAHRLKSLSARALSNAASILKTMPDMRTWADAFDHQPYQLNTPDGIIDLHTGARLDPNPQLWHTKQTGVPSDPNMPTPMWQAFLDQTFEGDTAMIGYVQRLVGLSAIGEVLENILPFLHGGGGNGKSVFLDTIAHILGDYAQSAPANFLMAGRDQHPAEIAKLRGSRFVIASEINEGSRFDEAKMKLLTGGDTISARFMRQDFFEFTPSHTLWLMGNAQPKVETGGESFWRRLRLIPFEHTVTKAQRVENLAGILAEKEGPGILAWAIQGAVNYLSDGLDEPEGVRAATSAYKHEEDHLARFIDDRIHIGGGDPARVLKSELRAAYVSWCDENGEKPLNGTAFGRQLKQKKPELGEARSHGRHYFTNLTLLNGDAIDGLAENWTDK